MEENERNEIQQEDLIIEGPIGGMEEDNCQSETKLETKLEEAETSGVDSETDSDPMIEPQAVPPVVESEVEENGEESVAEPEQKALDLLNVEQMLVALNNKFEQKIAVDAHKNELFDKMYAELSVYKKDIYAKLLLPFINETVLLIEDYKRLLSRIDENTPSNKILDYLSNVPNDLEELLENNGVECFNDESEHFNPKTQRALGVVKTEETAQDNTIAERVRKGYWWQGKIIRPEGVKVYKYTSISE